MSKHEWRMALRQIRQRVFTLVDDMAEGIWGKWAEDMINFLLGEEMSCGIPPLLMPRESLRKPFRIVK